MGDSEERQRFVETVCNNKDIGETSSGVSACEDTPSFLTVSSYYGSEVTAEKPAASCEENSRKRKSKHSVSPSPEKKTTFVGNSDERASSSSLQTVPINESSRFSYVAAGTQLNPEHVIKKLPLLLPRPSCEVAPASPPTKLKKPTPTIQETTTSHHQAKQTELRPKPVSADLEEPEIISAPEVKSRFEDVSQRMLHLNSSGLQKIDFPKFKIIHERLKYEKTHLERAKALINQYYINDTMTQVEVIPPSNYHNIVQVKGQKYLMISLS